MTALAKLSPAQAGKRTTTATTAAPKMETPEANEAPMATRRASLPCEKGL
jgi:hypothetical protein